MARKPIKCAATPDQTVFQQCFHSLTSHQLSFKLPHYIIRSASRRWLVIHQETTFSFLLTPLFQPFSMRFCTYEQKSHFLFKHHFSLWVGFSTYTTNFKLNVNLHKLGLKTWLSKERYGKQNLTPLKEQLVTNFSIFILKRGTNWNLNHTFLKNIIMYLFSLMLLQWYPEHLLIHKNCEYSRF